MSADRADEDVIRQGDSLSLTFNPEAMLYGRSFNIRRGKSIILHLIIRPQDRSAVINDFHDDRWGESYHLPLLSEEVSKPLTFTVSFAQPGVTVSLGTARDICFPRFIADGAPVELCLPDGISAHRVGRRDGQTVAADKAAWPAGEAAQCRVAEIASFATLAKPLSLSALEQGAAAVTLVDAVDLTSPVWESLRREFMAAAQPSQQVHMLSASWADYDFAEQVGTHDIVVCRGILSKAPDPIRFLTELRSMTRKYCYMSVNILPEILTGRSDSLDLRASGAIFLPAASPDVLQVLQEHACSPDAALPASSDWIRAGECNPHLQWWAMTRRHVERLVELAGFTRMASVVADDTQELELVLDARGPEPWLLPLEENPGG